MARRVLDLCESPEIRWPDGAVRAGFVRWADFHAVCQMTACKDLAERYRETLAIRKARREEGKKMRKVLREVERTEREVKEIGLAAIRQYREAQRKARKAQQQASLRKAVERRGWSFSHKKENRDADKGHGHAKKKGHAKGRGHDKWRGQMSFDW